MTKTELKPCPFCGGEAEIIGEDEMYQVICMECDGSIDRFFDTPEEAAKDWNTRTPAENELTGKIGKLESENKRLREALEAIKDEIEQYRVSYNLNLFDIDSKSAAFILETAQDALKKGKKNDLV